MPVVFVLSLPFAFILLRRPILRRLAFRNVVRRPRETALVVLGALLGTAIMTGSLVVGDTLDASFRRLAYEQLGPIDELVSVPGAGRSDELARLLEPLRKSPNVDGLLPLEILEVSAATPVTEGDRRRSAPRAQLVEMDFRRARAFGDDAGTTGILGATPSAGGVAISKDLANSLEVTVGDEIEVFALGQSLRFEVDRVLPKLGIAGLWVGSTPNAQGSNLFVSPGTLATFPGLPDISGDLGSDAPPQASLPKSFLAVSNSGGVEDGIRLHEEVGKEIRKVLGGVDARVQDVKFDTLKFADDIGAVFTQLFGALGMFGVLAGVLLLINIFVMLAEERKSEHGMLRAVGMRRSSLIGAFSTEGWFYALTSALTGTLVGLGIGRLIFFVMARIFDSGPEEFRVALHFSAKGSSVQQGFALGFSIALITVVITSIRVSRFNVIQAIREINATGHGLARRRSLIAGWVAVGLGVVLTLLSFAESNAYGILLAPQLTLVGMLPFGTRRFNRQRVISIVSGLSLVWAAVIFWTSKSLLDNADFGFFFFHGASLTAAAIGLVTQNQDGIGAVLSKFRRRSLALRLGLAYPLARRFRTSMTLAMFALVVFTITMFTVFAAMFANQKDAFTRNVSGAFDVVVRWNPASPIPLGELESRPGVHGVAALRQSVVRVDVEDLKTTEWRVSTFDEHLVRLGPPVLEDRGKYASDAVAYQAVLDDPNLILVDEFFLQTSGGPPEHVWKPGDRVSVSNLLTGRTREFTIAALTAPDLAFNGAFIGPEGANALFGEQPAVTTAYVDLDSSQSVDDAVELAKDVAGAYVPNGARADSIVALVDGLLAQQNQIFKLMQGYLALGLLVGVAGLGVIMVRAVRERRRQIGVLRALGFQAADVRRSFVIEAGFVAFEGVAIGVTLALLTTYNIVASADFGDDFRFVVPYVPLAILVGGTTIASLIATAAPARSAAAIKPAVALRIAD